MQKNLGVPAVSPSGVPSLSAYAYQSSVSLLLANTAADIGKLARQMGRVDERRAASMFHSRQTIGPVRPMTADEILAQFGSEIGRDQRHNDQRPHTITEPAAEMRYARTARPLDRQPQPDAAADERAQRHAQIRQDADRQRRRQQPGDRDKPSEDRFSTDRTDERRQARDETTKPKYDRYTGERLDGEGRSQDRGGGRGRSRSR
jgi:hypothetical protein